MDKPQALRQAETRSAKSSDGEALTRRARLHSDNIDSRQSTYEHIEGRQVVYGEVYHADELFMAPNGHDLVAVIPAHNEGDSIYKCLESIYDGVRWPDLTLVVANNCSKDDETAAETLKFQREHPDFPLALHDIQGLEGRKVGALCYAWEKLEGIPFRYFISMDADVILDENCIKDLYDEIVSEEGVGGVSARYNFDPGAANGPLDRFFLFWQRIDFAMWTASLLKEKNRETYVLGGQISIIDAIPMRAIAQEQGRLYPWSSETAVEDMELTWKINDYGYSTRSSGTARAWVGHMPTRRALWGQRMKWDRGIIDLLRDPSMKGKKTHYLKEPKRQQWRSLMDLIIRVLLYTALPLALLRGSYELFERWWMPILAFVPILLSISIGAFTAFLVPAKRPLDIFLALIYVPLEGYVWFRTALWARAWIGSIRGEQQDLWAAQSRSEGRTMGASASGSLGNYDSQRRVSGSPALVGSRSATGAVRSSTGGRHRSSSSVRTTPNHSLPDIPGQATTQPVAYTATTPIESRRGQSSSVKSRKEIKQNNKKRGNKHRFRWTLLPVTLLLTIGFFLLTFVSQAWWLLTIIAAFFTVWIALTLVFALINDALGRAGKKPIKSRYVWIGLLAIVIIIAIFGRYLVWVAIAWLKYLVYLAGAQVDVYLIITWYSLLAITLVLCTILVLKIFQLFKLRGKGLRP